MTALVKKVYDTVKAADPTLRFGIAPQGNPDNDLNSQYSDVTTWLAAGGEEQVGGLSLPADLLGLWLHAAERQHPLCL